MSRWNYPNTCSVCGEPVGQRRAKGLCQSCYSKMMRVRYRQNPITLQKMRESSNRSHARHRQVRNQRVTERNRQLRIEIIMNLGGKCACCGETEMKFLCLDHIKGGGRREYSKVTGPLTLYRQVKKEGFPKDKYRVLCWNCNSALGFYGSCPHSDLKSPVYHPISIPSLAPRMF